MNQTLFRLHNTMRGLIGVQQHNWDKEAYQSARNRKSGSFLFVFFVHMILFLKLTDSLEWIKLSKLYRRERTFMMDRLTNES